MAKMVTGAVRRLLQRLHTDPVMADSDQELLARYLAERSETAFEALVRRHGAMVLDVCRAVVGNEEDAEDAFQATFLVLARQAGSIRQAGSLAGFLHGVARRVSLHARADSSRRRRHEARAARPEQAEDALSWAEVRRVLHDELDALSARHREPLVLCYLQGQTQQQAAAQLGLSLGTLKRRLDRGRAILRLRLERRGLGPSAVLLVGAWPGAGAGLPGRLLASTSKLAGATSEALVPARVAALAEGVTNATFAGKAKALAAVLALTLLLALGLAGVLARASAESPSKDDVARPKQKEQKEDRAPPGKPKELAVLRGHTNGIWSVALTPDGKTLVSASFDKTVRVWDVAARKERLTLRGHKAAVEFVVITPDGKEAVSADQRGEVRVWDLSTGKTRTTLESVPARPDDLYLSADGRTVTGVWLGHLKQWDLGTGRTLAWHRYANVGTTAVSADGKLLVRKEHRAKPVLFRLSDLPSGRERAAWRQSDEESDPLAFSPDGKTLFSLLRSTDEIELLEVATGSRRLTLPKVDWHLAPNALHPGGRILAFGHRKSTPGVKLYDVATGEKWAVLKDDNDGIDSIAFSADGNTLAVAERPDTAIRIWDVSGLWKLPPLKEKLSERELEALWADLAGEEAAKAYRAVWTLAGAPGQSAPWIARRLKPVVAADGKLTARLVAELDDERQEVREGAALELEKLGESALEALREASKSSSAEVKRRARGLLQKLEGAEGFAEQLRALRAIEALELAGSEDAKVILKSLAGGAKHALRSREAAASLGRLSRRDVRNTR